MTRRVLRPQPIWDHGALGIEDNAGRWVFCSNTEQGFAEGLPRSRFKMPYAPGDRLWVREAFSYDRLDVDHDGILPPWYWADGNPDAGDWTRPNSSIHMPRWASRLTLTVTEVRVQRLQEISEADAVAEGMAPARRLLCGGLNNDPIDDFCDLWNILHGPGAWDENPWVAAISFRVHLGNIDQMGGGDG